VLLIMGSQDPDYADAAAIAQRWGNRLSADVLVVPDSGHYPHVDAAPAVAERTLAWVGQLPESVPGTRQATLA
ncbi:MAG: alpha/beta fold hydrolase, partial [Caldilineaceae bacterium]